MKMTINIDEDLLKSVMAYRGFKTKTEAIEMALKEIDRKARFEELRRRGLGLTEEELGDAIYPGYDPDHLETYDPLGLKVAEDLAKYGR